MGGNSTGSVPVATYDFTSTNQGWVTSSQAGSTVNVVGGKLVATASASNGGAQIVLHLTGGRWYRITADVERGSYSHALDFGMNYTPSVNNTIPLAGITVNESRTASIIVQIPQGLPASTDYLLRFRLRQQGTSTFTPPVTFSIDNVTVTELTDNLVAGVQPDVVEYHDYDPFGMLINKRTQDEGTNGNGYRYGYQGSEKDNEIKGVGNSYTTYYRQHDPRIGRWLSKDPKLTAFESPYVSMKNNPILYNDIAGDSIKTYFKNKDNQIQNKVPQTVQKMFNDEYGIKVGYNSKTKMLYYEGETETSLTISNAAKALIVNALKETSPKKIARFGEVHFGYNNKSLGGHEIDAGATEGFKRAYIDLADFNKDGTWSAFTYQNVPARAFNLGRTFEHEWIGHVFYGFGDNGMFTSDAFNPGKVEDVMNVFRQQMGLPIRINYGYLFLDSTNKFRNIIFFGPSNMNKEAAKKLAKENIEAMEKVATLKIYK